jgi:gamma-glutamyl:cysteine ligase YbdK (ATP-grasp superfamily)
MKQYHLFEGYGIELEYMLVDRNTLHIMPISDELLKEVLGNYGSDYENGIVTWSNELVLHVIELKSTKPEADLTALEGEFVKNIAEINRRLEKRHAMLMPAAAHPFMDPMAETRLWPHDNNEVYSIYNKIFDCRGHGWSNLQSTHLNLPFHGEEEFAKLHAAIRVILPLLPALAASSPILRGKVSGYLDTRLIYYRDNQAEIPSITGKVIPEALFTLADYKRDIYDPIAEDISGFDPNGILDPIWVNSRGAIPRFDRGSIEIRIIDVQECPAADLSIVTLVIETLKSLVDEKLVSRVEQSAMETDVLASILDEAIKSGGNTMVSDESYLRCWGLIGAATVTEIWKSILDGHLKAGNANVKSREAVLSSILSHGSLSERILKSIGSNPAPEAVWEVYRKLCTCLARNELFTP